MVSNMQIETSKALTACEIKFLKNKKKNDDDNNNNNERAYMEGKK